MDLKNPNRSISSLSVPKFVDKIASFSKWIQKRYRLLSSLQKTFNVHLKTNHFDDKHICDLPEKERKGIIHIKPSSFGDTMEIDASILCDTCSCEKVGSFPLLWLAVLRIVLDLDNMWHKKFNLGLSNFY